MESAKEKQKKETSIKSINQGGTVESGVEQWERVRTEEKRGERERERTKQLATSYSIVWYVALSVLLPLKRGCVFAPLGGSLSVECVMDSGEGLYTFFSPLFLQ